VSRRPPAYFSRLNRRDDAPKVAPRRQVASEPLVKPRDEPGVLWEAFHDSRPLL